MKFLHILGVLCLSLIVSSDAGEIGDSCYSQRGKEGTCTTIEECNDKDILKKLPSYTICKWGSPPTICCTSVRGDGSKDPRSLDLPLPSPDHPFFSPPEDPFSPLANYKCGHGFKPTVNNIVNGKETNVSAWPWMAAIYTKYGNRYIFKCSGAVINKRYIVSAAHCFKEKSRNFASSPERFEVRLREHDLSDRYLGERYDVEDILLPEEYAPPAQYSDIALLRIKGNIKFSSQVSPICLPTEENRRGSLAGKLAFVVGWGDTSYFGRSSTVLQQVVVPITDKGYCVSVYSARGPDRKYPRGFADPSILCAGYREGGKDACRGDSGGPLMLYKGGVWTVVGIVSGGHECARPDSPGIYTDISNFVDWIDDNTY